MSYFAEALVDKDTVSYGSSHMWGNFPEQREIASTFDNKIEFNDKFEKFADFDIKEESRHDLVHDQFLNYIPKWKNEEKYTNWDDLEEFDKEKYTNWDDLEEFDKKKWIDVHVDIKDNNSLENDVTNLLEERRKQEEERVLFVANTKKMEEIKKNFSKGKKVAPFTESQLKVLSNKYLQNCKIPPVTYIGWRPVYNTIEHVASCEESANAFVIINAIEKRYGNLKNMRHELWKPNGPMCKKIWNDMQDEV